MTLFLAIQGYSFFLIVKLVNHPQGPHGAVLRFYFGGTILYWLSLIFVVAVITMRLVAAERRAGTIEPLMTAPVSETQVVLGKYLAAVLFYAFLWLPTLLYVAAVSRLASQPVDLGPVAAGYLGTLGLGAAFIAVGLLGSVLVRHQIIAAVLTFAVLLALLMVGPLELFLHGGALKQLIAHINLFEQMNALGRGIVDTRHLVYQLSLTLFCLVCAVLALRGRKWR